MRKLVATLAFAIGGVWLAGCSDSSASGPSAGADETITSSTTASTEVARFATGVAVLDAALVLASQTHAPCTSLGEWTTEFDGAVDALVAATAEIDVADDREGWLAGDGPLALAQVETEFLDGHDCDDVRGDSAAALRVAARATGAIDDLALVVAQDSAPKLQSRFWVTTDQLGGSIEAERLLAEDGAVDLLIVGDSATMRGLDPIALGETVGDVALNVGSDGLLPSMLSPTIDEYAAIGVSPSTVVIGVNISSSFVSCDDLRPAIQAGKSDRRSTAFEGVAALAMVAPERRVYGAAELAYEGALLELYASRRPAGGHGEWVDPEPDLSAFDSQAASYEQRLAGASVCTGFIDAVGVAANAVAASGARAVVVFTPISPGLAELIPGDSAAIAELVQRHVGLFAPSVVTVDATNALTTDDFFDLTHANDSGRKIVTEMVGEAIAAAG